MEKRSTIHVESVRKTGHMSSKPDTVQSNYCTNTRAYTRASGGYEGRGRVTPINRARPAHHVAPSCTFTSSPHVHSRPILMSCLCVFNMSTVTPARGRVLWGGSGESCRVCVWARPGRGGVLDPPQPLNLVMSFVRKLFKTRDVWDAL